MFQQDGGGAFVFPAPLSKSHHDSVLGGGWAAAMRWEHSHTAWQTRTYCILLAVVVHSVPASSFTVFFFITVDTRAVESLLLVSWMSSFKTLQLCLRPRLAPSQSIRFLNSHSSPEVAAKHSPRGLSASSPLWPCGPLGAAWGHGQLSREQ